MPGKVNPVIPEMINQVAFQVMANDLAITLAAQAGQLELNAFLPLIAKNIFEMLDLLNNSLDLFIHKCIKGITVNKERCRALVDKSYTLIPALTKYIGYDKASEIARLCKETGKTVREIIEEQEILDTNNWMKSYNPNA